MHTVRATTDAKVERRRHELAEGEAKHVYAPQLATKGRGGSRCGDDDADFWGDRFSRLYTQAQLMRTRRAEEMDRFREEEERDRREAHARQLGKSARAAHKALPTSDVPQTHERLYALAPEWEQRRERRREALQQAAAAPRERWDGEARPLGVPLVNEDGNGGGVANRAEGPSAFERLHRQGATKIQRQRGAEGDAREAVAGKLRSNSGGAWHPPCSDGGRVVVQGSSTTTAWRRRLTEGEACHRAYQRGMELKLRREQRADVYL